MKFELLDKADKTLGDGPCAHHPGLVPESPTPPLATVLATHAVSSGGTGTDTLSPLLSGSLSFSFSGSPLQPAPGKLPG